MRDENRGGPVARSLMIGDRIEAYSAAHPTAFAIAVIMLFSLAANYLQVFGLKMLFLDDNARYYAYVTDSYRLESPRAFIGLGVYLKWLVVNIYAGHSAELGRFFVIAAYMIPTSVLFFFFNLKIFKLPYWLSLTAAVLVNSVPRQVIPMFLDGSYPTHGMLSVVLALWAITIFLEARQRLVPLFIAAVSAWIVVSDLIGENSISILPAVLILITTADAPVRRKLLLATSFCAVGYLRLQKYFATAGVNPSNQAVTHSPAVMFERVRNGFEWWLPSTVPVPVAYAFMTTVIVGVAWVLITGLKTRDSSWRATLFYSAWFAGTCAPFWFLSKYFGVRYFYIPYFALTSITLLLVWQISSRWRRDWAGVTALACVLLMSVYCVQRYRQNIHAIERWNRKHDAIHSLAAPHLKREGTQFVMANLGNLTGGYYVWSSGYLQRLLGDPSVRGVMGHEKNFYDPFNLEHCGYQYTMSCLRLDRPLVGFHDEPGVRRRKMNYFLRWVERPDQESKWHLLKTDSNYRLSVMAVGAGMPAYKAALARFEIKSDEVLFGNLAKYTPSP